MISVRWRPSSWIQFSNLFFQIVHGTGQQLTIDRTNFLTDGFLQIIQRTGFLSVNTWFQIPAKKKISRCKIGRASGPRHVSETGNEVPGKHVSNNGHWLVCSVRCGTILLKPHIGTVYSSSAQFWPSAYLLSTTHSKDVRFPWVTLYLMWGLSCLTYLGLLNVCIRTSIQQMAVELQTNGRLHFGKRKRRPGWQGIVSVYWTAKDYWAKAYFWWQISTKDNDLYSA